MNKYYKISLITVSSVFWCPTYATELNDFFPYTDAAKTDVTAKNEDTRKIPDINELKQIQGKLILGQKEWIHFPDIDQSFRARVDSGAATSSLNAKDLKIFTKNGKKWVRFRISDKYKSGDEIVLPVSRWVRIRQVSNEKGTRRPVIKIWVKIGERLSHTEFTLADRSHLEFPVLLGRSYIIKNALVDVSRQYVQKNSTK